MNPEALRRLRNGVRLDSDISQLLEAYDRLKNQIKEGCETARNFGGDIDDDDDEPKWCVAAAVVADRNRRSEESAAIFDIDPKGGMTVKELADYRRKFRELAESSCDT